jgi:hypothetical protein
VAEALLAAWQAISDQVSTLSRRLITIARQDQTAQRLTTVTKQLVEGVIAEAEEYRTLVA